MGVRFSARANTYLPFFEQCVLSFQVVQLLLLESVVKRRELGSLIARRRTIVVQSGIIVGQENEALGARVLVRSGLIRRCRVRFAVRGTVAVLGWMTIIRRWSGFSFGRPAKEECVEVITPRRGERLEMPWRSPARIKSEMSGAFARDRDFQRTYFSFGTENQYSSSRSFRP